MERSKQTGVLTQRHVWFEFVDIHYLDNFFNQESGEQDSNEKRKVLASLSVPMKDRFEVVCACLVLGRHLQFQGLVLVYV